MRKITQKDFFSLLEKKKNILLGVKDLKNLTIDQVGELTNRIVDAFNFDNLDNQEFRNCKLIQTNALMFSNDSWLYKKAHCKYFIIEKANNKVIYSLDQYNYIMMYYIK